MPIRIEQIAEKGYILVDQTGEITVAEIDESRPRIRQSVAENGVLRVLVDVRGTANKLSTIEYFSVTERYVAEGFPRPRAALVCRPDQFGDVSFIESVAVNRGLPLKVFISEEEALQWLLR